MLDVFYLLLVLLFDSWNLVLVHFTDFGGFRILVYRCLLGALSCRWVRWFWRVIVIISVGRCFLIDNRLQKINSLVQLFVQKFQLVIFFRNLLLIFSQILELILIFTRNFIDRSARYNFSWHHFFLKVDIREEFSAFLLNGGGSLDFHLGSWKMVTALY